MILVFQNKEYKNVSQFYEDVIHKNIKHLDLFNKQKAEEEARQAKALEQYFQMIKNYIKSNEQGATSIFAKQILDNMQSLGIDISQLFDYGSLSAYYSGAKFENEIANIIRATLNTVSGQNISPEVINIGTQLASNDIKFTEAELKKHFGKFINFAMDKVVEKVGTDLNGQALYKLRGRQGKIDINVPESNVTLSYTGQNDLIEFYKLLQGASFSAKNYIASEANEAYITLGHTSFLRVYSTTIKYLTGADDNDVKTVFFATRNSRSAEAKKHKQHLRFIYELTGPGLRYENGQSLGMVKYLIVNSRNTNGMRILSTRMLIYNMIMQDADLQGAGKHLKISFSNGTDEN